MFLKTGIKCPECGKHTGTTMHMDQFPCSKCDHTVTVEYHGCLCGFSWRTADGIFVDGMKIDVSEIDKIMMGAEDFLDGLDKLDGVPIKVDPNYVPNKYKTMADMIHKCLRCGSIAIEKEDGVFECTDETCGFSWEVDTVNE